MPKYLIADFIVEIEPKFDYLKNLCEPFLYEGERSADFSAIPSDSYLNSLLSRMVEGSTIDEAEEFATASIFDRKIIHRGAMLVHSSALVFDGKSVFVFRRFRRRQIHSYKDVAEKIRLKSSYSQ